MILHDYSIKSLGYGTEALGNAFVKISAEIDSLVNKKYIQISSQVICSMLLLGKEYPEERGS